MKTKLRTVVLTLCLVVLMASMAVSVLGTELVFTKAFVDSNQYTLVTGGYKETRSKTAEIYITEIYKADGSDSTYSRVYVRATGNGSKILVYKGEHTDITLPSDYWEANRYVALYMMGRDPSLDCRVSGYWIIH